MSDKKINAKLTYESVMTNLEGVSLRWAIFTDARPANTDREFYDKYDDAVSALEGCQELENEEFYDATYYDEAYVVLSIVKDGIIIGVLQNMMEHDQWDARELELYFDVN